MEDVIVRYLAALDVLGRHVHAIPASRWSSPTPCSEWDVRALLDHLVYETLWVPDLLAGATLADVGDRYEGDRLGHDPVAAWDAARSAAVASARSSPLDVPVHTSGGDLSPHEYLTQMLFDAVIHGWDLATAIGVTHEIPDDVARDLESWFAPQVEEMVAARIIAEPVPVGSDADAATRLIALSGRAP